MHAQESPSASADATNSGVYVGGQLGVLAGSSLWSRYDLVDGSGSHFGGFNLGYLHRRPPGVTFGGEVDLSFGAEPRDNTVAIMGMTQAAGGVTSIASAAAAIVVAASSNNVVKGIYASRARNQLYLEFCWTAA